MPVGQRTKSSGESTDRRILEHARRAFNERGVASVGVRDIARDLGLSPGNVSYHFPTKEQLVVTLAEEAHARNSSLVAAPAAPFDFAAVRRIVRQIMQGDLDHRWFTRDAVGLLASLPTLRALQSRMQQGRAARVDVIVERLMAAGLLDRRRTRRALPYLRVQLVTQLFFWLPAAFVEAPDRDPAERRGAHERAALALFLAHCTPSGRRQLEALLRARD